MNGIIYQPNQLIEQIGRFGSLQASDVYYLLMEKINPKLKDSAYYDESLKAINIPIDEVKSVLDITDNRHAATLFKRMDEMADRLCSSRMYFTYQNSESIRCPIFSEVRVSINSGITATFNDKIIKNCAALLDLTDGRPYTRIPQKAILKIRSEQGRRMAELVSLFPAKNGYGNNTKDGYVVKTVSAEYVKEFMGSSPNVRENQFKQRILEKAIKDINNADSGYQILSLEPHKEKRQTLAYTITAKIPEQVYDFKSISPKVDKESVLYKYLERSAIKPNVIVNIILSYTESRIWSNLLAAYVNNHVLPNVLVKAIKEDWAAEPANLKKIEVKKSIGSPEDLERMEFFHSQISKARIKEALLKTLSKDESSNQVQETLEKAGE